MKRIGPLERRSPLLTRLLKRWTGRRSSLAGPTYLLRAEFNTDIAAPLPSPLAVDVGSLTILDTNSKLSVSSGAAQFATGGVASGDPGVWGDQLARVAGRAVLAKLQGTSTGNSFRVGWDSDQSGVPPDALVMFLGTTISAIANGTTLSLGGLSAATDYRVAVVQRGGGQLYAIKGGTEYPEWTLLYVSVAGTAALYPAAGVSGTNVSAAVDWLRALDLAGGWESDYGIATQRLAGSVAAGTAFTHEANCLLEYTKTTIPASGSDSFQFRKQDANNYWEVAVSSTGAITLNEVVAGTPTARGSAAGVVSNGHRVVVIPDGSVIRVYSNDTLRFTYSSATNFATATAGSVASLGTSGATSDVVAWPRTISGAALSQLNAASA